MPGPSRRVVDFVRLVEQPYGRAPGLRSARPSAARSAGRARRTAGRAGSAAPSAAVAGRPSPHVRWSSPKRLRRLAKARLEHGAARQEAVVHEEDPRRCPALHRPGVERRARQRFEPARRAKIEECHAFGPARVRPAQRTRGRSAPTDRERMTAGGAEEVVVSEVDTEEPDALRAEVTRQVHGDVRRVCGVVQALGIGAVGATARPSRKRTARGCGRSSCVNTALACERSTWT